MHHHFSNEYTVESENKVVNTPYLLDMISNLVVNYFRNGRLWFHKVDVRFQQLCSHHQFLVYTQRTFNKN
ncbi:hypothetical protein EB796_000605 [Bugula neritina]|uniref:Uncharacterized protein n=1 Tax=Bugula neritina TaxID=10212 RepID=A0A7J7KSA9_BUGNE|nr:hypothetical protein EB796_000605 [Bugula neritina]